ncbi:hemicentin-1-like [Mytilus trossulus]|uniref:hemicentin-1-like n=1 Tax=Mytilus trossulus TaxID=6551 RepID=UPI003005565D
MVPINVTVPQSSYSVLIDNSVTLICNVAPDLEWFDVYWERIPEYSNESSVLAIDSEMLSNMSTKYSGSNNNTPSLTIFDVEKSDGGIYICFAYNEYGTWNSSDIHLTVHVPLEVTIPHSSYSVLIGNSVTLICNVTSDLERFDVYWQRISEHSNESAVLAIDSEMLSNLSTKYSGSNNNTPSLTIFDVETSDGGIYICFAANEYGTWNSSDIHLTVSVPIKVTVPQSSYSVLIDNSVTLICNVASDLEWFDVYWEMIPEYSNESSVLAIDTEMISNISKKYSGSNNNTPSLTIFDVETSDGGIYICFASNEYGTWKSSEIHLTVHVPLNVTVPQSSYSVLIGNSVTLICYVASDLEWFDVYWEMIPEYSNEYSVLAIDSEMLSNMSTKYSGSNNNTPSLTIFDVETSDGGIYICFAANEYGTWNSSDIHLTVHVPLNVTVPQSSYSVLIGNSVTLICNVTSDLEWFDVYWKMIPEYSNESSVLAIDSEMLSNMSTKYSGSNNNTPSLTIVDVETSDGGIYICFAYNEYGTWNISDIHLTVHVPLNVTVPQSSYSVLIGNSVTLICNVASDLEWFDVYWEMIPKHNNESSVLVIDSMMLSNMITKYSGSNKNTPSLTIFDVETSDGGIYICFASNEYGEWNSSDIHLTVHVPLNVTVPQSSYSVLIDNTVTLICNVTSDLEWFDVYWEMIPEYSNESSVLAIDSEMFSNMSKTYSGSNNNTPSLTIFDVETSDGGIYICFAANKYGTWNSSDIHLIVNVPLNVTVPQSSYSVLIGNSVTLICNVASDLEWFDVYWEMIPEHSNESSVLAIDSEMLSNISTKYSGSNNNTPSLTIFDVEKSDGGIYICFAANEYGDWNSSDIHLTVHVPLNVTVPQSSYSVLIGNSVTLICNVTSDLEWFDVYWEMIPEYSNESSVLAIDSEMLSNMSKKYSGSNNNTPSLTIFGVETSDGGIYICFAANEYGTWNSSDIHLTVHVPIKVTVPQSSYSVLIGNSVTLICNVTSDLEWFDVYWEMIPEHSNESSVLAIDSEMLSNISTKYSGSNNNTPSLTIFDVETSDGGIYICFAYNAYGDWNSSDIHLTVHVPLNVTVPQSSYSVLIGNSVTLICNVASDLEWFDVYLEMIPEYSNESSVLAIDSEMLSNMSTKYSGSNNNTPSLTIFDVETSDGGIYICFAYNEYGTWNSSDIHLTVHVPLNVTVPLSSYSVLIGNSVTLICNVTSDLEWFDVYWEMIPDYSNESSVLAIDSEMLSNMSTKYSGSNNNTPSLTIFGVETSDGGVYICFADNEYGTWNSSDIHLTVHGTYTNCNKNMSYLRLHTMLPVGYCLDDSIVCYGIDVTDTKNISIVRGVEFIDIKAVPVNDSMISFDLCITMSLHDLLGFHQVIITVSTNESRETNLTWNIEVEKSTCVLNPSYEVEVLEYESVGSVVFNIDSCPPDNYTILSSIAEQSDDEIRFTSDNGYGYIITSPLNAYVNPFYRFQLMMTENNIVLETVNVTIVIVDSSKRPLCPSKIDVNINLLDVEGDTGYNINCTSYDNRSIDYVVSETDYFGVLSSGEIRLNRQLPRFFDTITFFEVMVTYDGNPLHSETVIVVVHLNNSISAVCSPIKTEPAVWILNACVKIEMNCSDPTQTDSTNLWYYVNLIGSRMQAFTVDDLSNGVYNLCYNLTESGQYELSVIVWNDLLDNIIHITLDVDYVDTTPQFINSSYSVDIPENIPTAFPILSFTASVDYGDLSYSIQGQKSIPVFEITKTGVIQTTSSLRPYTDHTMQFKVQHITTRLILIATASLVKFA